MLDVGQTRKQFIDWVGSPAFDAQFDARSRKTSWPWIAAFVSIVAAYLLRDHGSFLLFVLAPLFFLLHGYNLGQKRKAARKNIHLTYTEHVPVLGAIVIGNQALFTEKGAVAPSLIVGSFDVMDETTTERITHVASLLADLHGETTPPSSPDLQEAWRLVNDDTYQPDRRRKVPQALAETKELWLFDTLLVADDLPVSLAEGGHLICMASAGPVGSIIQIPPGIPAFRERTYDPNIIQHSERTTHPPLVAPHSDNLEAVEKHIARHLGTPASVFHELVSTTVHIDIHFVPPTPEKPWVALVTSGMSDIPMNAPEGAGEFRFAELMIRLPANWPLGDEAFKQEENYWPVRCLKFLARFVHEYETWLCFGHTIPNGNPAQPYAPGLPFTGVILHAPSLGPELAVLTLPDGTPIRFWSIIPLHSSEMAFKLEHGADALLERFETAGHTDLFDPQRPPVI